MPLNIVSGSEPVTIDTLVVMIYGEPGSGKTSLGFSSREPLSLDFDRGSHRSANRRDHVPIDQWSDVTGMTADDLSPYSTIMADTVGRCLDVLTADLQAQNPKIRTRAGGLTLQGWGDLKASFAAWIKTLRGYGKDVVLIAHDKEDKRGDDTVLRADIQGGSYSEVFKQADAVGYLYMHDGKRFIDFDPSESHSGKNPANLGIIEVPDLAKEPDFMADLMQQIKDGIGQISAESKAVADEVQDLRKKIDKADTARKLNGLYNTIANHETRAVAVQGWKLLKAHADEIGATFDKDAKKFALATDDSEE